MCGTEGIVSSRAQVQQVSAAANAYGASVPEPRFARTRAPFRPYPSPVSPVPEPRFGDWSAGGEEVGVEAEGELEAVGLHEGVVGEHVDGAVVGDEDAVGEDDRARAELEGVGQVVGHQQHGDVEAT